MPTPLVTRLRYIQGKDKNALCAFLSTLSFRVQIYGAPVLDPDSKKWTLWFVPEDDVAKDLNTEGTPVFGLDLD